MQGPPSTFIPLQEEKEYPFSKVDPDSRSQRIPIFDPVTNISYLPNSSNSKKYVFISRLCSANFMRDEFHPSLVQNKISIQEFNNLMDRIESECYHFRYIKLSWVLTGVLTVMGFLFLLISSMRVDFTSNRDTDDRIYVLFFSGIGFLFIPFVFFGFCVLFLLLHYQNKIERMLKMENMNIKMRGVEWSITTFCNDLKIILS